MRVRVCVCVCMPLSVFQDRWEGIVHHVTGSHEWIGGGCEHSDLVERDSQEKSPLAKDSLAMKLLRDLVLDRRFLKSMSYYVEAR